MANEETNLDEATVSRVLHYVHQGKCKPAIVEEDFPSRPGRVNLVAFILFGTSFLEDVHPNHHRKTEKTWHWPRECSKLLT